MTSELWDFSLRLYGVPDVAKACLALQDECGVDVPILLFAAWLTKRSVVIGEGEVAQIDMLLRDWRASVVEPLRGVRRWLKSGPLPVFATSVQALREDVKRIELNSEKIELQALEEKGRELMAASRPSGSPQENCLTVLRYFADGELEEAWLDELSIIERALKEM